MSWWPFKRRRTPLEDATSLGGFVDLHGHFLPEFDDGAASLDEALEMLEIAARGGTRSVACTPHLYRPPFRGTLVELRERFEEFRQEVEAADLGVRVVLGAEHQASSEFFEALATGDVVPLGGGQYLLVELPLEPVGEEFVRRTMDRVHSAGYKVLIAHVERHPVLIENQTLLRELVEQGCLVQVNAVGVLRLQRELVALYERGLIHVVASDAHDAKRRSPDLSAAAALLVRAIGKDAATRLLRDWPLMILGE